MAILRKMDEVYAALDAAVALMPAGSATGNAAAQLQFNQKETVTKITTKLKNRRSALNELLMMNTDPAAETFAAGDAQPFDHFGVDPESFSGPIEV